MVNAAPENETNEGNEANEVEVPAAVPAAVPAEVSAGPSERLPLQLSRLPADKLMKVHEALMQLQEAGLSEVPDLAGLSKVVKKKTDAGNNARLPFEDLTSEYMSMTLWAWTPKRWFDNVSGSGKAAGAKSEVTEVQAEDTLPPEPADLQKCFEKRIVRFEKWNASKVQEKEKVDIDAFRAWFEVMKKAADEVRSLASMEASQTQAGDGTGVLFEKMPSAGGPRVLPKVKVSGMKEMSCEIHWKTGGKTAKSPSAVISVHLGGEGCDVGLQAWQKYMSEHLLDGSCRPKEGGVYGCSTPLFAESTTGRFIPRAILAGYDGGKLDTISQAGIFAPTSIFAGNRPSDNSWSAGQNDSSFIEEIHESIRRQMEQADYVEGLLFNHGAGQDICMGGVAAALYRKTAEDYSKQLRHSVTCVPDFTGEGDRLACTMLSSPLIEYLDLVTFYDRTSLQKMAHSKVNGLGLASPDYGACTGLAARLLSGITGPLRFGRAINAVEGSRLATWSTDATNLCPYPRIHFMVPSLGGVVAQGMEDFSVPGQAGAEPGFEAAGAALRRGSLSSCISRGDDGKIIAINMFCRGVEQSSVIAKVAEIKTDRKFQFVDWSPTGFAIYSYKDPKCEGPEVAALENNTSVAKIFDSFKSGCEDQQLNSDEGGELAEALENVAGICKDFEEVGAETSYGDEEEDEEY